jgi:cellulose synthase/poly-beta-1,6-N-acetylglucosamine synthase-like glycosyltransferase
MPEPAPPIILFYPVLREREDTMRTTLLGLAKAEYPAGRRRIVAIPNSDDRETIASLNRLRAEYPFLEVLPVPPTTDGSWGPVWSSWDLNPKAYWWHVGRRAGATQLPPKKTRQLVWAMYQLAPGNEDALLSYIDADSVVPRNYFTAAALGMRDFDVLQCTNVTGNLLQTWASSFFAMDHFSWDISLYRHITAGGKHPYWVLGKGVFYRFRDLLDVGGFHPWLTIEDPEIGMRLWVNGRRLGIVDSPLIEEVPATFRGGLSQRKRWVAGFFQSLTSPLTHMGMPFRKRWRARMNFVPCLSLIVNPIGYAVGLWILLAAVTSATPVLKGPLEWLTVTNLVLATVVLTQGQVRAWRLSRLVLPDRRDRARFVARVNPLFLFGYWLWWSIPLMIGFWMFVRDTGLVWERTEKRDANHQLVRETISLDRGANAPTGGPEESDLIESGPAK